MKRIKRKKEEKRETKKNRRKMKMKNTVLPQEKRTLPNELSTAARRTTYLVTK
jgi:hypothetical protein